MSAEYAPLFNAVVLDMSDAESTPQSILRVAARALDNGRDGYEPEARNLRNWADQIEAQTKPPKPTEPTGLGAVVEDSQGQRWIRHSNTSGTFPWLREGQGVRGWTEFDAVHVLSEGVTA